MRIAIVSRDFPPVPSGMGDYADLLSLELARRGHEVSVICAEPVETRSDVEVRPVLTALDARNVAVIDATLGDVRPDAVLWQYNPFQIGRKGVGPSAGRLARTMAAHAPLILVAHELWYEYGRNGLRGFVWATAQRIETRAAIAASSKVVVTTDARRDMLRRRYVSRRDDILSIRIGANIEPDPMHTPNGVRAHLGAADDSLILAHFGSIGDGRDLSPAFDALRRLRGGGVDARLVLIGRSGSTDAPADLRDAIRFTGVLTRREVSDTLAVCDAYLFCEPDGPALGRKGSLLAAFAHGLPVVAFAGHDRDEALRDGENVVLVKPSGADIAHAVRALRDDPRRAAGIGGAAKRLYEDRFSWQVVADGFEAILEGPAR